MVFTAKQNRALASAAPALKATLARAFNTQNSGRVPGESRDVKQSRAAQNHQRWLTRGARQGGGRRNNAAFAQMVSSTSGVRGVLPTFAPGMRNWSQTPASSNIIAPRGFGFYDAFAHGPHETATALSLVRRHRLPLRPLLLRLRAPLIMWQFLVLAHMILAFV